MNDVASAPQAAEWLTWRTELEEKLMAVAPSAVVFGQSHHRLPQTICISMPNVKSETQLMNLDLAGFAVSAGSACSSGRVVASHVLLAMGMSSAIAETAIRISWGWQTAKDELYAFAELWKNMAERLSKTDA